MKIQLELYVDNEVVWINKNSNIPVPRAGDCIKVTDIGNLLRVVSVCFMYNSDTTDKDVQTIRLLCEVLNDNSN